MASEPLTHGDLAELGDAALELFGQRRIEEAKGIIEGMLAVGYTPSVLLLTYAVCLSELGEEERAKRAFELARSIADREEGSDALLERVEEWLPGGKQSRGTKNELKGDAERWLPRTGHEEKK